MATYSLRGFGTQALTTGTTRLVVNVTNFPANNSVGRASPGNYYDVGLLRAGVQGNYGSVIPIDAANMFVDLPVGADSFGFSLFGTATINVSEQALMPGGNPSRVFAQFSGSLAPGASNVTLASYVVPSNRAARISQMTIGVAGNGTDPTMVQGTLNGSVLGICYSASITRANDFVIDKLATPFWMVAGDTIRASGYNFGGASITALATFVGLEVDYASVVPE